MAWFRCVAVLLSLLAALSIVAMCFLDRQDCTWNPRRVDWKAERINRVEGVAKTALYHRFRSFPPVCRHQ